MLLTTSGKAATGGTAHRSPPLPVATAALAGLAVSATALAAAPALIPASYSWVTNTTSESAAQGITGAWLARLGFVLFGLAVIALAVAVRRTWGAWASGLHYAFGAFDLRRRVRHPTLDRRSRASAGAGMNRAAAAVDDAASPCRR